MGNDIVDRTAGSKHRPQYYQRQQQSSFYRHELDILKGFEAPFWLLWAIKEASFKAAAQAGRVEKRFNPKDFELIEIHDSERKISYSIICEKFELQGLAQVAPDFIHTLSWTVPMPHLEHKVMESQFRGYQQQSKALKEDAIKAFALATNNVEENLAIEKDQNQIPYFQLHGHRLPHELSLSHHGRFIAYAFTL